jgi:hypothetical protein
VDGEVAQLAALVISANYRLANPGDPMRWFATQRAFARCGSISFEAATKRRSQKPVLVPLAETAPAWLDALSRSGTTRVVLGFERQDEEHVPGETIPDRIAAGFAGGGSLWTMTTESGDGQALGWRATWRAAFPNARDGRVWAVRYTATKGAPQPLGRSVTAAATELKHALAQMSEFAWEHDAKQANTHFTSALALLEGAPDPLPHARPMGPAETLDEPARRLIYAAQRGWVFDNMELWAGTRLDHDNLREHGRCAEALYDAVTAAMVAAVNSSVVLPRT